MFLYEIGQQLKSALDDIVKPILNKSHHWEKKWKYQACSEFGWFPTSIDTYLTIDHWLDFCREAFFKEWSEYQLEVQTDWMNDKFGGLEPNVTNVLFVHGEKDPWSLIGRTKPWPNKKDNVFVDVMPNVGHCTTPNRTLVVNSIKTWIQSENPENT